MRQKSTTISLIIGKPTLIKLHQPTRRRSGGGGGGGGFTTSNPNPPPHGLRNEILDSPHPSFPCFTPETKKMKSCIHPASSFPLRTLQGHKDLLIHIVDSENTYTDSRIAARDSCMAR